MAAILVTGDFILDHHIYEGQRRTYSSEATGVRVLSQVGGAELVAQVLRALVGKAAVDSLPPRVSRAKQQKAYAFWRPFEGTEHAAPRYWRVSETMGFGPSESVAAGRVASSRKAGVVVVSDGGMGFRDNEAAWPTTAFSKADWIVLKMSAPIAEGKLFDHLRAHQNRLAIIVGAHDIRKLAARVSQGLSWDATLADLVREVQRNPALTPLTRCRHLIVQFDLEGALWIEFTGAGATRKVKAAQFVYDAAAIEGECSVATKGSAFGFHSCLTASVSWQLISTRPDIVRAIEGGLAAMRDLLKHGHGPATDQPNGFPANRLASVIQTPSQLFSRAALADITGVDRPSWSILGQSLGSTGPAYDLARLVLLRGPIALASVPHLAIGKLRTAERREIESLRMLVQVVRRYESDAGKRPLSLAVFGPPGAGKSFAVKEVAGAIIKDLGWLEFNLSQFSDADDLIGAFHQIRDQVLQKKLPVAFFDEFDAHSFKWLAPLLAPMQDGKFQDGQITHTLGKCIFVFAGGTSATFETFGPPSPEKGGIESRERREFRLAKGPDFHSRLDGYLDVVGPNRRLLADQPRGSGEKRRHHLVIDTEDVCFPIRRALMIRAELGCAVDQKLDIDEGLVQALLKVDVYTHGARSLSKVLQPLVGRRPLRRSLILPPQQLAMHVNAGEFASLADLPALSAARVSLTRTQVLQIAPQIHDIWRHSQPNSPRSPKRHRGAPSLDFQRRSQIAAAQRMVTNLRLLGYELTNGQASTRDEEAVRARLEYALETLAEAEHDGWMKWYLAQGWRLGEERDYIKREHPCLKPYTELPTVEAEKDRDAVRNYPAFARSAGMKISTAQDS